jgi:hypothetical protein
MSDAIDKPKQRLTLMQSRVLFMGIIPAGVQGIAIL